MSESDPDVLNRSIFELELPTRVENNLDAAGIKTIGQLTQLTVEQLPNWLGKTGRTAIRDTLKELKLSLLNDPGEISNKEATARRKETALWWQAFCATKFTLQTKIGSETGDVVAAIIEAVELDVGYRMRFADLAISEARKRGRA